jgi:predicted metal-binding protein
MWKISVPHKLHIFLWLLANNKNLTKDNLAKRRKLEYGSCLFCTESESVTHLFFECCVAQVFWRISYEIIGRNLSADFESVAKFRLSERKFKSLNVFTSTVLWTL